MRPTGEGEQALHDDESPKLRKAERAAQALERSGIGRIARRLPLWRGVLVLNYHRIGDASATSLDPGLFSATPEQLDEQLALLERRFDVVMPSDLVEHPDARGRRVLITFDDGYRDNFELALPILQRRGIRATFFLAVGYLDRPRVPWWDEIFWMVRESPLDRVELPEYGLPRIDLSTPSRRLDGAATVSGRYRELPGTETEVFLERVAERTESGRAPRSLADGLWMSWDEARALRDAGMAIGGHTVDHPVLARLTRDAQRRQIDGCAARLREELGIDMSWFSYPIGLDGAFDENSRELVAAAGTRIAFEFRGGYQAGAISDPLSVPRAGVPHEMSLARFGAMLALPQRFSGW